LRHPPEPLYVDPFSLKLPAFTNRRTPVQKLKKVDDNAPAIVKKS
jgi:hypothetical protein